VRPGFRFTYIATVLEGASILPFNWDMVLGGRTSVLLLSVTGEPQAAVCRMRAFGSVRSLFSVLVSVKSFSSTSRSISDSPLLHSQEKWSSQITFQILCSCKHRVFLLQTYKEKLWLIGKRLIYFLTSVTWHGLGIWRWIYLCYEEHFFRKYTDWLPCNRRETDSSKLCTVNGYVPWINH